MPTQADPLLRDLTILFRAGATGGLTDGDLLRRFVERGDEAAFEVLVHRLGPMVLGVCRRALRDPHDAEDAFQAAFVVLARRAASVDPPERVGPWLHGVAQLVATRARRTIARRRAREVTTPDPPDHPRRDRPVADDLRSLLDAELGRLPAKYRDPIVLFHLEGKGHREAARELGWREGTFSGRLSRGRALLASRLARRGVVPSAGALVGLLSTEASAQVPASLTASVVGAAFETSGLPTAALAASAGVTALTRGALRTMLMTKLHVAAAAVATVVLLGVGAASGGRDDGPEASPPALLDGANPPKGIAAGPGSATGTGRAAAGDVAPRRVEGKVIKADPRGGQVVLNVGTDDGVSVGMMFYLSRGWPRAEYLGKVRVAAVEPDLSVARVIGKTVNGQAIEAGDWVATAFRAESPPPVAAGVITSSVGTPARSPDPAEVRPGRFTPNEAPPAAVRLEPVALDLAGDEGFLRRIYLDVLGRAPTPEEIRAYKTSDSPDKAEALARKLVDDPSAVDRMKQTLRSRVARYRESLKPPTTARFEIAGAVLDRVDREHGNLLDVHLGNGHDGPRERPPVDTSGSIPTVMVSATRLVALHVSGRATITIEPELGPTTTGRGEAMFAAPKTGTIADLKPGMLLDLKCEAGGRSLIVTEIKAHQAQPKRGTVDAWDPLWDQMDRRAIRTAPQPVK